MANQHYEDEMLQLSKQKSQIYWDNKRKNDPYLEFYEACKPLMEYLKSYHPHVKVIVDSDGAELMEGLRAFRKDKYEEE